MKKTPHFTARIPTLAFHVGAALVSSAFHPIYWPLWRVNTWPPLCSGKVIGGLTIENDDKASVCLLRPPGLRVFVDTKWERQRKKEAATPELSPWPPAAQRRFTKLFMETTSLRRPRPLPLLSTCSQHRLMYSAVNAPDHLSIIYCLLPKWLFEVLQKPASQLKPFTETSHELGFHCVTVNLVCL